MPRENNQKALKSYLESLMLSGQIEELADNQETIMRMGAGKPKRQATSTNLRTAHGAVQKLARNEELTLKEEFLIEAIIIPEKRPVVDIEDGEYHFTHELWQHFNSDPVIKRNILNAIPACGRIELPNRSDIPYGGTGFFVGDNLIMTNRHVAELFVRGIGVKKLRFVPGQTAAIDTLQEFGSDESQILKVIDVKLIHPFWDMALLEVEEMPNSIEPLTLSLEDPASLFDNDIAIIGYPAFDPRNRTDVQNEVFRGEYNVKRLQPGHLKSRRNIRSFGHIVNSITHDASTLGGNSGSAVIDVRSGEVIALHFGGRYKDANFAVPTIELARDEKVVNMGVEFGEDGRSEIIDPNPYAKAWEEADPQNLEKSSSAGAPGSPNISAAANPTGQNLATRWTIPITIEIGIGSAVPATPPVLHIDDTPSNSALDQAITEKMVEPIHDNNYCSRNGYDPEFLGLSAPIPIAMDLSKVSKLDDGQHVLDYHHFSLVMEKNRRMPLLTAANVDTNPARLRPEAGKKYTRKALNGFTSKNDREKWFLDPRIPAQHQLPEKFFNKDRQSFDKGHVVRRNAVVWGNTYKEIQHANGDTFHVTNCTPQVKGFNRSNQRGIWGKLENHIFDQAKTEKLCIFAGPVLKPGDPVFSGFDDLGSTKVRIPRAYWKIVIARNDDKLAVFPFLLEQDLSDVDFEFVATSWKTHMRSLGTLQNLLDEVEFDPLLHNADQFGQGLGESVRSSLAID